MSAQVATRLARSLRRETEAAKLRAPMRLLLTLSALCLLGCPQGGGASSTTAAPARGAGAAALLPARVQAGAEQAASQTPPAVLAQTAFPGLPAGGAARVDRALTPPVALTLGGEPGQGVIEGPSDEDRFQLWLPAGHALHVDAHCYGEIVLELRSPSGAALAHSARSLSASIAQPGTYSLSARALTGQGLHYTIVTR